MITETFSSFFTNIKQKTTNPFLGTLIIVWSICNWKLLYTFFTFDSNTSLEKRIASVENYIQTHNMFRDLGICIFESIFVLIITYILLNFSRVIINLFENIITPWVYKLTKSRSIVIIDTYNFVIKQRDDLSRQFDSERADKLRIQSDIESTKIKHDQEQSRAIQDNLNLRVEIDAVKSENEQLELKLSESASKINKLTFDHNKLITDINKYIDDQKRIKVIEKDNLNLKQQYDRLNKENETLRNNIKKYTYSDENINFILETLFSKYHAEMEGLIKTKDGINHIPKNGKFIDFCIQSEILIQKIDNNNNVTYLLTPFGEKVRERYLRYFLISPSS